MKLREFVKDYLTFTRKEKTGIFILLFLLIFIWSFPFVFIQKNKSFQPATDTAWVSSVNQLFEKNNNPNDSRRENEMVNEDPGNFQFERTIQSGFNNQKTELFNFNPNTLNPIGWRKLGIRDKTIQTIQNYLSKGGRFYKPEDLQRIYGLGQNEYDRLAPYIKIEPVNNQKKFEYQTSKQPEKPNSPVARKPFTYPLIEINTADRTAFIVLPGIGSILANRIIKFRDKLGGFYAIEQIAEVYGLQDSTFQKIKSRLHLSEVSVKQFNINTATKDEMKAHPYIRWNIANAIVEYRNQHGEFSSLADLKKIVLITDDVYEKIIPYFKLQ